MRELGPEDIQRLTDRIEIVEAIDSAIGQGAHLMSIAEDSETVEDFRAAIEEWLGCSPVASRAVAELQMRRMPRAERRKIADDLAQSRKELAEHREGSGH